MRMRLFISVMLVGLTWSAVAQDREPPLSGLVELASEPSGAEVFAGDSLLGKTPLRVRAAELDSITLWYPIRSAWNAQMLRPAKEGPDAGQGIRLLRFSTRELFTGMPAGEAVVEGQAVRLPAADVLVPAGVGLLAGIAAVMLKQKADAFYDDYLLNGDESLLSETKKYDIYAGVSLAVLQLGLGYFIYRLFDE